MKVTKKRLLNAITGSYGNITVIAKKLGCQRAAVYEFLKKDEEVKTAVEQERERIVDLAENKLVDRLNKGDTTLIVMTLKTLGKNRGYGESIEHTGTINQKIVFVDHLDE